MILSCSSLVLLLFGANVKAQGTSSPAQQAKTFTTQWTNFPSFALGQNSVVNYNVQAFEVDSAITLRLMQTSAINGESIIPGNSWAVTDLQSELCRDSIDPANGQCTFSTQADRNFTVEFAEGGQFDAERLQDFFFCFSSGRMCASYSPLFSVQRDINAPPSQSSDNPLSISSVPLPIQTSSQIIIASGQTTVDFAAPSTISVQNAQSRISLTTSSSMTTVSEEPTATRTINSGLGSSTADAQISAGVSGSKSGLSTGAIVGIALGALIVVAIFACIFVFLCLRRRRRRREHEAQGHEQVMLTRSLHPLHGGSRDLLTEKDAPRLLIHPNSTDSNFSQELSHPNSNDLHARDLGPSRQSNFRETFVSDGSTLGRDSNAYLANSPNSPGEPGHNDSLAPAPLFKDRVTVRPASAVVEQPENGGRDSSAFAVFSDHYQSPQRDLQEHRIDLPREAQLASAQSRYESHRFAMETNESHMPHENAQGQCMDSPQERHFASSQSQYNDASVDPSILPPQRRQSALGSFDFGPSVTAALNERAVSSIQRKPTAASQAPSQAVSNLSRNLSSSTAISQEIAPSPQSPHSPHSKLLPPNPSPTSEYSDYPEPYSPLTPTLQNIAEDRSHSSNRLNTPTSHQPRAPRYGDARHSPHIFAGPPTGIQAPFLNEPNMSPEEAARVEEEERMIDAAIAAAEARERLAR